MEQERSEDARAAGLLRFTLGGEPVEVPVLRIRPAREWRKRLSAVQVERAPDDDMEYPIEVMLDLLVAYDVTGALGGRDRIEDRATDREVYAAFKEVLTASFPFVKDSATILTDDFTRMVTVALLVQASSTNGASAHGDSPPTSSRSPSLTSSSSSSTTPDVTGSARKRVRSVKPSPTASASGTRSR